MDRSSVQQCRHPAISVSVAGLTTGRVVVSNVCRYELCLLNQAIYSHFPSAHKAWLSFSAPNSLRRYAHRIEIGNRRPDQLLRFVQAPSDFANIEPVRLTWDLLHAFTRFFLDDYMARFLATRPEVTILRRKFHDAVGGDAECNAWVLTHGRWEKQRIIPMLRLDAGKTSEELKSESRGGRKWTSATPKERADIEESVRSARDRYSIKDIPMGALMKAHKLMSTDKKAAMLLWAGLQQPLDLSESDWQEVIRYAALENGHGFFRRLGRLLTKPSRRRTRSPVDAQLPRFLFDHWAESHDGLPELFYLSFPDLLTAWKFHNHKKIIRAKDKKDTAWLEQAVLRLGLKPLRRRRQAGAKLRLDEETQIRGELRFRRPDGWLYP